MIKISIVSYLNALPFLRGLESINSSNEFVIEKDNPNECARKLVNKDVQIGLVPVAAISQIKNARIISNYCIGANGPVRSVCLLSNTPKEKIKRIYLDPESRTSNILMKIIAAKFWDLDVEFVLDDHANIDLNDQNSAFVIIGDRAFNYKHKYRLTYDLSEEWKRFTGLPFVFACWITNTTISNELEKKLNIAFKYGLDHIDQQIDNLDIELDSETTIESYLKQYISYDFDEAKKNALELFNQYSLELGVTEKQLLV